MQLSKQGNGDGGDGGDGGGVVDRDTQRRFLTNRGPLTQGGSSVPQDTTGPLPGPGFLSIQAN